MSGPYRAIGGQPIEQWGSPILRKYTGCKEEHGYDAFFAGRGIPSESLAFQQRVDYIAATPWARSLDQQRESAGFYYTFGRPMGSMERPVTAVAHSFPWHRKQRTPTVGPLMVGSYVRAMAGDMLRAQTRGLPGPYQNVAP